MTSIQIIEEVLHRIRVQLYPNYLHHTEGEYIARIDNEALLTIEQICAALVQRGGFTGNYNDLVQYVRQFFHEAAYQLCNGFAVSMGYFSLHPRIGGIWKSAYESFDPKKHPIRFAFRTLQPLRKLAQYIKVDIEGVANQAGYIDEITDIHTEAVNETLTPGGMFTLAGHRIKATGEDPACGVFFVNAANPDERVKSTQRFFENTVSRIVGVIPPLGAGQWHVEVVTQYSPGSFELKQPRTIAFTPVLTVS
jgi:hypothetical protein